MSLLDRDFVQRLTGDADSWFTPLDEALDHWEINTSARTLFALAQWTYESAGFRILVENLHYSAARLRVVWPNRFKSDADAEACANNEYLIAERVYGGRFGNRPEGSGDGFNYRGRDPTQTTFLDNYRHVGEALGLDLEAAPQLLEVPQYGVLSAGYYWYVHGCNEFADALDFTACTKAISGATTSDDQRRACLAQINRMLS